MRTRVRGQGLFQLIGESRGKKPIAEGMPAVEVGKGISGEAGVTSLAAKSKRSGGLQPCKARAGA
jgi:hypothetical protein